MVSVRHTGENLEGFAEGYEAALQDSKQYEQFVEEFAADYVDEAYLVVALNEEAGEIAGWYKKFVLRGNPVGNFSREDLKGELGDLLYYLTRMANINGWSINEVQAFNMAKLRKRVEDKKRMVV